METEVLMTSHTGPFGCSIIIQERELCEDLEEEPEVTAKCESFNLVESVAKLEEQKKELCPGT